ncbi:MAG: hypothetical protein AAB414_00595 [Patescibacteria group bacterium]
MPFPEGLPDYSVIRDLSPEELVNRFVLDVYDPDRSDPEMDFQFRRLAGLEERKWSDSSGFTNVSGAIVVLGRLFRPSLEEITDPASQEL